MEYSPVGNAPEHGGRGSAIEDAWELEAWRLGVEIEREISRACSPSKAFEGFFEAVVMPAGVGATKIQWVQYSGYNFFEPVPDVEFGWIVTSMP